MRSRFASVLARNYRVAGWLDRLRSRMRWAVVVVSVVACGALVALSATSSTAGRGA